MQAHNQRFAFRHSAGRFVFCNKLIASIILKWSTAGCLPFQSPRQSWAKASKIPNKCDVRPTILGRRYAMHLQRRTSGVLAEDNLSLKADLKLGRLIAGRRFIRSNTILLLVLGYTTLCLTSIRSTANTHYNIESFLLNRSRRSRRQQKKSKHLNRPTKTRSIQPRSSSHPSKQLTA